jgi:CheY-like chemotaxis protein
MPLPDPAPVLIVDDDDLVVGVLRTKLERLNIPVVTASSAEEALALVETMHVGALVLDQYMPGQTGLVLAEFVRLFGAHLTGVPIMIFTGGPITHETREMARRFNADIFTKPDGLNDLLQRLANVADPFNQMLRIERLLSGNASSGNGGQSGGHREPES